MACLFLVDIIYVYPTGFLMLSRGDHLLGLYIRIICTTKVVCLSISLTSCEVGYTYTGSSPTQPDGLP